MQGNKQASERSKRALYFPKTKIGARAPINLGLGAVLGGASALTVWAAVGRVDSLGVKTCSRRNGPCRAQTSTCFDKCPHTLLKGNLCFLACLKGGGGEALGKPLSFSGFHGPDLFAPLQSALGARWTTV